MLFSPELNPTIFLRSVLFCHPCWSHTGSQATRARQQQHLCPVRPAAEVCGRPAPLTCRCSAGETESELLYWFPSAVGTDEEQMPVLISLGVPGPAGTEDSRVLLTRFLHLFHAESPKSLMRKALLFPALRGVLGVCHPSYFVPAQALGWEELFRCCSSLSYLKSEKSVPQYGLMEVFATVLMIYQCAGLCICWDLVYFISILFSVLWKQVHFVLWKRFHSLWLSPVKTEVISYPNLSKS